MPPLLLPVFRQPRSERIKRRIRTREGADIRTAIKSCLMELIVRDVALCLLRYNYVYSNCSSDLLYRVIMFFRYLRFFVSFVWILWLFFFSFFENEYRLYDRKKILRLCEESVRISILRILLNDWEMYVINHERSSDFLEEKKIEWSNKISNN